MSDENRQVASILDVSVVVFFTIVALIEGYRSPQLRWPMGIAFGAIAIAVAIFAAIVCMSAGTSNKEAERDGEPGS